MKKWIYKNKHTNAEALKTLSKSVSPIIAGLLLNRGITSPDEAKAYFSKPLRAVHSPFLLPDMDIAVDRITKAIENREKIVVYGDYDVDGITSTVLIYKFLSKCGADVSYYIPTRTNEGYGINIIALNKIIKSGVKLLITVDCGITAVGEIEFAKLQGLDVIITDHHNCPDKLPAALAVINPKRPDSTYPFSGLAGVGVAFKLALAVASRLRLNTKAIFSEYSELAAIGTIADIVPLTDENRIITDRGLKKLQSGSSIMGIAAILEICGTDPTNINSDTIAFTIAPRLNASGRLNSAAQSVELLLADDYEKAKLAACALDAENTQRRATEQEIFNDALKLIENDCDFDKKKVIVLHNDNWHQGVIGIVASRICEKFFKPTILISTSDENGKGSGRSIPAFDLFSALNASSDFLVSFGGHNIAAGLNIRTGDIDAFSQHINAYADKMLCNDDFIPSINLDMELPATAITLNNIKFLSYLEPFGMQNEAPVFSMCDVVLDSFSLIGAEKKHIRMTIVKDGLKFNCIGFGMGFVQLSVGEHLNIAFSMVINNYQERELIQLQLKDIQKNQERAVSYE